MHVVIAARMIAIPGTHSVFFFSRPRVYRQTHTSGCSQVCMCVCVCVCVCVSKCDYIRRFIFEVNCDGDVRIWIKMFASRSVFLVGLSLGL